MLKLVSTKRELNKINKEYGYYVENNENIITVRHADGTALIEIVYIEKDVNAVILTREDVLWPKPPFVGEELTKYKGIQIYVSRPYLGKDKINVKIAL